MTLEQNFFISLLKYFIHNKKTETYPADINWKELFRISEEQNLCGVIYSVIQSLDIPREEYIKFHEAFYSHVYYAINRKIEMVELAESFKDHNIDFVPFKGWIVKDYWPVPELRSMGDIDILIHHIDRKKVDHVMKNKGYSSFVDNHAVWTYFNKINVIEIHDHMFYEHLSNKTNYIDYFDKAWDYYSDQLDINFHLLYLIVHMAKHITNKGIGFRGFMDLIFVCEYNRKSLDWDWIICELKKLDLYQFAQTCFALTQAWFDVASPIPVPNLKSQFFETETDKIFSDGLFGIDNPLNDVSSTAKEIRYLQKGYLRGALSLTVKRIFPPYRDMQLIPWYSFVDGKPWLLPLAWVYRWFYCLTHKFSHSISLLAKPFIRPKQIQEKKDEIKNWGL